jgi:hypothetical protein
MPTFANSQLHCSICKKPFMPFSPNICKDENDNIVHIACYMQNARSWKRRWSTGYQRIKLRLRPRLSAALELLKG